MQVSQPGLSSIPDQCETHQWMVQGFDGDGSKMKEAEQIQVSEDLILETERFWESPQRILNLIDLLFLWEDEDMRPPCS